MDIYEFSLPKFFFEDEYIERNYFTAWQTQALFNDIDSDMLHKMLSTFLMIGYVATLESSGWPYSKLANVLRANFKGFVWTYAIQHYHIDYGVLYVLLTLTVLYTPNFLDSILKNLYREYGILRRIDFPLSEEEKMALKAKWASIFDTPKVQERDAACAIKSSELQK